MAQTVGEFFVQRLKEWGVRTIFGYPGDGINGVLRGLEKSGDDFVFVQARHEEMAAFMACAYAKFSGDLGVCLSTGGPGATHLLTGLYDAKLDHTPGARDHRAGKPLGARRALPAGAQPRPRLRRRRRLRPGRDDAAAGRRHPRPGDPHGQEPQRGRRGGHAERPLRLALRGAGAGARLHPLGTGLCAAARRSARERPAPRRRGAQRGQEGGDARRRRRPAGDRRSDRGRRSAAGRRGEGAARQGSAAGRSAVGHRDDRPARLEAFIST